MATRQRVSIRPTRAVSIMLYQVSPLDPYAFTLAALALLAAALLAVLVLALGICGVTTMFSVVNGVMLRGFSFPNSDRLAGIQIIDPKQSNPFGLNSQIFALDYEEMRGTQTSFELMAAYINGSTINATIGGNPQRYTGAYVTPDFFRILGVRPVKGRDFTEADNQAGAEKTSIISHQLWQRDFGGDPNVVGKGIVVNGKPATVVGIMSPGFEFPGNEQLWVPLYGEFSPVPRNDLRRVPPAVLGLMKPGVTFDQANSEFTAIARQLADAYPDTNKQFNTALIEPLIKSFTNRQIQGLLWTMLAFCVGILLIACVNVMNMQFARAALRANSRILQMVLRQGAVQVAIGLALGLGLSFAIGAAAGSAIQTVLFQVSPSDPLTYGAVSLLLILVSAIAPLVPARRATRVDPMIALRAE